MFFYMTKCPASFFFFRLFSFNENNNDEISKHPDWFKSIVQTYFPFTPMKKCMGDPINIVFI